MYSCMQGLSPRSLMEEYKLGLRKAGLTPPKGITPAPVGEEREYRKVPMERLLSRLALTKYNKKAPLQDEVVAVKNVQILLSQHIGAPAVPVIEVGEQVQKGQLIAEPAQGLSVAIHASITGKVTEVTERFVTIEQ